ncbi:MAG TPA: hypothetical protein VL651_15215 [Bacteroidia bacterium]|jgi:hypothetical protein|nr:hypothetical protein [Bacteroidia bacterium]
MKKPLLFLFFVILSLGAFAQDTLYKTDNTKIACKVTEIGSTEIKYKKWDNQDGPVYSVDKSDVRRIVYANGTSEMITQDQYAVAPTNTMRARKRAITTRPLSPLDGFVCIGYQQALTPSRAVTTEVGLIGPKVGTMFDQNANGFYFKGGMRFKRVPDVVTKDMQWSYALGGFYFEPQIMISNFSKDISIYNNTTYTTSTQRANFTGGAFLMNIGRQSVFGDILTLDLAAGIGYGFESDNAPKTTSGFDISDLPRNYYSHWGGSKSLPIAYKFSFSIGVLLP